MVRGLPIAVAVVAVLLALISVRGCEGSCIIANRDAATERNLLLSDVTQSSNQSTCNTTSRQVYRLLDVNEEYVLVGSTECLYLLHTDLTYKDSWVFTGPLDTGNCRGENPSQNQPFVCKNYISHGFASATHNFTVCGTYDAVSPRCWNCNITGTDLSCDGRGFTTAHMPTDPIDNVTAILTQDKSQFFIGGQRDANNLQTPDYQISSVNAISGNEELTTASADQVIYTPLSFVGEPIEHGGFIYMFFREVALEDFLQTTVYSRIARIAKGDIGGQTSPLRDSFTTYLKTRLMCTCGETYPVAYNEIQDIEAERVNGTVEFLYGLFTKRNSKSSSSSAICRYKMSEVVEIFNSANRRGPSTGNTDIIDHDQTWSMRPKRTGDGTADRATYTQYPVGLYQHLLNFPLLNTNVPNCGLGQSADCTGGTRSSHNALAVFQNIRGQQLTVSESSNNSINVYIGTNNRKLLKATISTTSASVTEDITFFNQGNSTVDYMGLKWPHGISSLTTQNGYVYGNTDTGVFRIQLSNQDCTVSERRNIILANHTLKIENAVTNFFTMFDAAIGSKMTAHFSGLFNDTICSSERFDAPANTKENLHVSCRISTGHIINVSNDACTDAPTGVITIQNGEGNVVGTFEVPIVIDCSDLEENVNTTSVLSHDNGMANYRYEIGQWIKERTSCNTACPSSDCCSATCEP